VSRTFPIAPSLALLATLLIAAVGNAISQGYAVADSSALSTLHFVGVSWAVSWWVLDDCRQRRVPTSIDHGWFVFWAWCFLLPVHLIRTRGWGRGLAMAGTFLLFYIGAWVVSAAAAVALRLIAR